MFVYKGKEYKSKSAVIRYLYDTGKLSLRPEEKKKVAKNLKISVSAVHITLINHIGKNKTKKKNKKISISNKNNEVIFINDKPDDIKKELMKDPNVHAITFSPNKYGLPVTTPPMYVVDKDFDIGWNPPPEEQIERMW